MSDDLRLDGNAAAGLLSELFAVEVTAALLTCAACGARGPVGAAHVYDRGPGTIVRCPSCTAVLLRVARIRGRLVADLRGVAALDCRS
jgi:hypothetical protein